MPLTVQSPNRPPPTMRAEIAVPNTANSIMEPRFWKKLPWGRMSKQKENHDTFGMLHGMHYTTSRNRLAMEHCKHYRSVTRDWVGLDGVPTL